MKKSLLLLAIIPLAFAACSDEKNGAEKEPGDDPWHCEDCEYERYDVPAKSIGGGFSVSGALFINKVEYKNGTTDIRISPTDDNYAIFTLYGRRVPEIMVISVHDPIEITGDPYNVSFDGTSEGKITFADGEFADFESAVRIYGWLKEHNTDVAAPSFAKPIFNGEVTIQTIDAPQEIVFVLSGIFS